MSHLTPKKIFYCCVILSILMIAGNVVFKKYYSRPVVTDGFDYRAPAASRNKANLTSEITSCNFSVKSYELTFRSQVILSRSLLPKKPEADFLKNSVEEQLKFLYGYFNYGNRHGNEKIFLTSKKIELSNLRTTSAEYPEKIDINEEWTEHPTNIYVENAHEIRKVKKGEQAVAIDYEATLVFRTCGAFPEKKVEILLPKDPFLAYWAIDTSQFIKATYLGSEATINPCSNSSFAEIRKSSWFWYTWDPVSELCKSQIKGSKFYTLATGQVKAREDLSSVPINAGFFPDEKNLEVSVVMGFMKNKKIQDTMRFLNENLKEGNALNFAKSVSPQLTSDLDVTLPALQKLLSDLPLIMQVNDVKIYSLDPLALRIAVKGSSGGKSINLEIFYGVTSIDYLPSPAYTQFAITALAKSDFIMYTGHAGMGKNFSLSFLAEKANKPYPEIQKLASSKAFQAFLIISCYSNIYFGEDILASRSQKNLRTLLIRSAAEDYVFQASLGLINFLAQPNLNKVSVKSFLLPVSLGRPLTIDFYGG